MIRKLASGRLVEVDPMTRTAAFLTCPWHVQYQDELKARFEETGAWA